MNNSMTTTSEAGIFYTVMDRVLDISTVPWMASTRRKSLVELFGKVALLSMTASEYGCSRLPPIDDVAA